MPQTTNVAYASGTNFPPQTDSYLITEFDRVVAGGITAEEYLAGLQETFDEEFSAGTTLTPFAPAGRG